MLKKSFEYYYNKYLYRLRFQEFYVVKCLTLRVGMVVELHQCSRNSFSYETFLSLFIARKAKVDNNKRVVSERPNFNNNNGISENWEVSSCPECQKANLSKGQL